MTKPQSKKIAQLRKPPSSRNIGIDLLRAFAVLLVLFHHMDVCGPLPDWPGIQVIGTLMLGGWVGVDCFFVLSGFLVSGLLFSEQDKTGRIRAQHFLIRRGLKIYPAFYAMLLVTLIVYSLGNRPFEWQDAWGEALFLQNYLGNLWRHTWSLAIEEHFYLGLVPVLLIIFKLARHQSARRVCLLVGLTYCFIAIACLLLRLELVARIPDFQPKLHQFPTHLRIDSLFLGVFACSLVRLNLESIQAILDNRWYRYGLIILGCLLLSPAFQQDIHDNSWLWTYGFLQFAWGSLLILLPLTQLKQTENTFIAGLAKLGTYSYSIYLWHMMAGGWLATRIQSFLGGQWWIGATSYFILCLGIGVVASLVIEWPVLKLRDRYFPSKSGQAVT